MDVDLARMIASSSSPQHVISSRIQPQTHAVNVQNIVFESIVRSFLTKITTLFVNAAIFKNTDPAYKFNVLRK